MTGPESSSFASKFISRIGKVDHSEVEKFVGNLLREKDLQRVLLDSLQEGVFVVDGERRVMFANEACRGLLGWGGGRRIVGQLLSTVLRARRLQDLAEEFDETCRPVHQREVRVRTPKPRVYSVTIEPLASEDDRPGHAVWIITDQTEARRRAVEERQVENMRSLATLTAGIAHEVKNPLNSLNIHAQLIQRMTSDFQDDYPDDPRVERLGKSSAVLTEEIARLSRIVDQFIKAVRPSNLNISPVPAGELFGRVLDLVGPECKDRRIDLVMNVEADLPPLPVDPEQLEQALLNVAKNAMEAIDKPEGQIEFRASLAGEHALIEIEDNGCGIEDDDKLRIFEPYHTTKFHGSGLGLMVVFRIISAHKGLIGLDSVPGQGTVFKMALPLGEKPVRLLESEMSPVDQKVLDGGRNPA